MLLSTVSHNFNGIIEDPVVSPCGSDIHVAPDINDDNYFKYIPSSVDECEPLADLYGDLIPVLCNKRDKIKLESECHDDISNDLLHLDDILPKQIGSPSSLIGPGTNCQDFDFDLIDANGINLDCFLDDLNGFKDNDDFCNYDGSASPDPTSTLLGSPLFADTSQSTDTDPSQFSPSDRSSNSVPSLPPVVEDIMDFAFPFKTDIDSISDIRNDGCNLDNTFDLLDSIKEDFDPLNLNPTIGVDVPLPSKEDEEEEIKVDDDTHAPVISKAYTLASEHLTRQNQLVDSGSEEVSPFGSNTAPSYVHPSSKSSRNGRSRWLPSYGDTYRMNRPSHFSHHRSRSSHPYSQSGCSSSYSAPRSSGSHSSYPSGSHHPYSSHHNRHSNGPSVPSQRRHVTNHGQSEKDRRREQNRVQRFAETQVRRIKAFRPYQDQYFKRPRPTKVGVLRASIAVMEMYHNSDLEAQIIALRSELIALKKRARPKHSY